MTPHWLPEDDISMPVPENVEVGEGSMVYSAWAFVHYRSRRPCGLRMGRHSALWSETMLELGPDGEVEVGDWCTLLDIVIATNSRVTIGDHSMIGHRVVIADRPAPVPPDVDERANGSPEPIVIGSNTWVTAGSIVLPGARIGDDAIVGAGAVIDGEVPAGATAFGNPYRLARSLDSGS
jgi:acetyltransferase-like isoleucine patch superfamily enzyme